MQERINVYAKNGGEDVKQITNIFDGLENDFVLYFVNTSNRELGRAVENRDEKYIVISDNMDDFENFKKGLKIYNQIKRFPTERIRHEDYDNLYYVFDYEQMKCVIKNSKEKNLLDRCYISLFGDEE